MRVSGCVAGGLLLARLREAQAELRGWLAALQLLLRDAEPAPLGDQDPLERLLDASNVSACCFTLHCVHLMLS